jgi:hypothetical protein
VPSENVLVQVAAMAGRVPHKAAAAASDFSFIKTLSRTTRS